MTVRLSARAKRGEEKQRLPQESQQPPSAEAVIRVLKQKILDRDTKMRLKSHTDVRRLKKLGCELHVWIKQINWCLMLKMETMREIITFSCSRHWGTFILKFNKFKSVKEQIWFVLFSAFDWTSVRRVVTCVDHKQHRVLCFHRCVQFLQNKSVLLWKCVKLNVFCMN